MKDLTDDERKTLTTALLLYFFCAISQGDEAGLASIQAIAIKLKQELK
jgi:hypothetical protein